ncbi:hypothetical protein PC115_g12868 [Phytophthora cactorum]|uniref:Uncharacterized protein n=1 Tax=Phytophthora cactorum TaxID=29920 RepID=A0A8T1BUQ3_9STRA|nr:hypothetical protein PC115_g12868 [Phytophthora cactorum]
MRKQRTLNQAAKLRVKTPLRPSFSNYLSLYADIVHSPTFEAAVVKVPAGDSALLTAEEAEELEPFKIVS